MSFGELYIGIAIIWAGWMISDAIREREKNNPLTKSNTGG